MFNFKYLLYCLFVVVSVSNKSCGNGDVFMSSSAMNKVFQMEQEMVSVINKYKELLESSLMSIHTYVNDVQDLYNGENCWPVDKCDDETITQKIVGNPIYGYQILKRLHVYWKNLETSIKEADAKKTLLDLKKVKARFGGLPTDADMQGAAKALNRLQEMYRINVTQFTRGNILGLQTGAELGAKDTLYLGRFAYMQNNPIVAMKWLEEAVIQAAMDGNKTVKDSQIQQVIKQVQRKLTNSQNSKKDAGNDNPAKFTLLNVPSKTNDINKLTHENDRINYAALCRGEDILPAEIRKDLMCFLTDQDQPYFKIAPIKTEVHYQEPHKIMTFHDIFTKAETDALIEQGRPLMNKSVIGVDRLISEMRVSKNAWLEDESLPVVNKVSKKIDMVTGLQTTLSFDKFNEGKKEEYEFLQIANYGIGGHYDYHQDSMFVYKEPENLAMSTDPGTNYITGDRMTTFMIYLSDVGRGGWTAFPRLGVAVPPKRGSAVFWHNLKRSGRSDMAMLHGGCPVVLGSKWVANKWIREAANIFHRPCIKNIDV